MPGSPREASARALVAVLALQVVASVLANAVVFQKPVLSWLGQLYLATRGWVHPDLVANAIPLVLVVGVGMLGLARLRLRDIGLRATAVGPALLATALFWLGLQGLFAAAALFYGGPTWVAAWRDPGPGYILGPLLGQVLGNALVEEAAFRGFWFPQLGLKLQRRLAGRRAWVAAAFFSQGLFALMHIPNYVFVQHQRFLVGDALRLLVNGLILLWVFVRTQNLLIAVGVHALWNTPAAVVQPPAGWLRYALVVSWTLAFAELWHWGRRAKNT